LSGQRLDIADKTTQTLSPPPKTRAAGWAGLEAFGLLKNPNGWNLSRVAEKARS
jgi:hypothetical protein